MILILPPCFIIDAFLHQIHSATQKLKTMEARVAEIMEKQVFSTLDDISNFYLFDIDEAFARTWVCLFDIFLILYSIWSKDQGSDMNFDHFIFTL